MSSVTDIIKCILCGRNAHYEYESGVGTTFVSCFFCGYLYYQYILIDRKHEKKTGERIYKLTKDRKRISRIRERIGHGGYFIQTTKGFFQWGGFPKAITKKDIEYFSKVINQPGIDKEKSYLLSFDPKKKELTAVIGKIPVDNFPIEIGTF